MLERIQARSNEILWWEIACILHDIGKFSRKFHHYRQIWHKEDGGWANKDPHVHDWFDSDDQLPTPLRNFFQQPLAKLPDKTEYRLTIQEAVHGHAHENETSRLIQILDIADGMDSRYDRNSPLISNEQTRFGAATGDMPPMFRANVFGRETEVDIHRLESHRAQLYAELWECFSKYAGLSEPKLSSIDYFHIKKTIERYFEPAMSDTTRPDNDTSLWEHIYAVTCLAKAFHAEDIALNRNANLGIWPKPFTLWGVGFDSHRYAAFGHRIGDITARYEVFARIFDRLVEAFEFEYALGNCIYRDSQFQIFLFPEIPDFPWDRLTQIAQEAALAASMSEILPAVHSLPHQTSTTAIVQLIEELRHKSQLPQTPGVSRIAKGVSSAWRRSSPNRSICPICRLRPERRSNDVCSICLRRRTRIGAFTLESPPQETPFLSEIEDENGRVALIAARFGLRDWLSGQMVRSSLVTEPHGMARMDQAVSRSVELQPESSDFKKWLEAANLTSWQAMLDVLSHSRESGSHNDYAAAIFARGIVGAAAGIQLNKDTAGSRTTAGWDQDLTQLRQELGVHFDGFLTPNEALLNAVCAKTPTPSTIFDTWRTTEEFFQRVTKPFSTPGQPTEPSLLSAFPALASAPRQWLLLDRKLDCGEKETVTVDGLQYLHTCRAGISRLWCLHPRRASLPRSGPITVKTETKSLDATVQQHGVKQDAFFPYRTIVDSPDVLLLLVPANLAPQISQRIYSRYKAELGKAYGRLPLAIGNIFFPTNLPMFSVLDTAWRMIENFRLLQQGPWMQTSLPSGLPTKLGTCETDFFHPYAITPGPSGVPSQAKTVVGYTAHFDDLSGKPVLIRPNLYDAVILGGSADRLSTSLLHTQDGGRSPASRIAFPPGEFNQKCLSRVNPQPVGLMLLEDLETMLSVWDKLDRNRVSSSAIRNFEFTIQSRLEAWNAADPQMAASAMATLAHSAGKRYFHDAWEGELSTAFSSGLLLRSLLLHLRVLKARTKDDLS